MTDNQEIIFEIGDFTRGIQQYQTKFMAALLVLSEVSSKKMEEWAKQNAVWTDRTGNARQLLKGQAFWADKETIAILVSHGVDYGIWLELAHERRYAILEDAIEENKDAFLKAVGRLINA